LAFNNGLLVMDLMVVKEMDLAMYRSTTALVAILVLLAGLIWERR
jgi:hypothetical protein